MDSSRRTPVPEITQRVFGELKLVHYAPTGMSVYAIYPTASGGGSHLRSHMNFIGSQTRGGADGVVVRKFDMRELFITVVTR